MPLDFQALNLHYPRRSLQDLTDFYRFLHKDSSKFEDFHLWHFETDLFDIPELSAAVMVK